MMFDKYTIILFWSEVDDCYLARIPDLPGAFADGKTYEEALTAIRRIGEEWIEAARDAGREGLLPEGYRWDDLEANSASDRLKFYNKLLLHLGTEGKPIVQEIYANANSFIKKPLTLSQLVTSIDNLDWYDARKEGLGD